MCTSCGCGENVVTACAAAPRGQAHAHQHAGCAGHDHGGEYVHDLPQQHVHTRAQEHAYAAVPGAARRVQIEQDILASNDAYAVENRRRLAERGIFALNLVSSPGSGKTALLCRTIAMLDGRAVAVVEGDQQTSRDAERIRATGAPAIQINTGKGCHLDAHMVGHALDELVLQEDSLLLIENVGNLICPAAFDLGEAHKVAILSVTEGEDKPLKYPDMFRVASLMLLNKVDLLPHLAFDVDAAVAHARRVNPDIRVIRVSATSGVGMDEWLDFLHAGVAAARAARLRNVESLKRRISRPETEAQGQPP